MAIRGSLREAGLPDVIQLLFLGRRTGCLAVTDRQNFGYIFFDDGAIVFASIVNRRDRLGDLLLRHGKVTADDLRGAIDAQDQARDRRVGELLVERGVLTREELEQYIRLQIEEAVYYLFTWTSGTFTFESGVRPDEREFLVRISPEWLLLEGARRVDEWSLIEKKVPSFDLIFAVDREHLAGADVELAPEQARILPLLDGQRDVRQLVEETGLTEFEVAKALYGFLAAGFARQVGTSEPRAPEPSTDARVEEHRNLGIAFYKTGMLDEASREFRRVLELRPADAGAAFYSGLLALRHGRLDDAVTAFRQACERAGPRPAALHNLAVALERGGRLEEAECAWAEAVALAKDDPRLLLGWGIAALKRNDVAAATERLLRARELAGARPVPASWYWAMTLAQALAGDGEAALATARAAVAAFPEQPVLRNNLAVLQEQAGDVAAAEQELRAAFVEDPALPQVSKNLGDLLYRAGKYEEAGEAYERAARLAPDLGDDLHFKLGNIAYRQRDLPRARQHWERALALNPQHELVRANLQMLDAAEAG